MTGYLATMNKIIGICLILVLTAACRQSDKTGKEFVFPDKAVFTRLAKDTVPFETNRPVWKIVAYADTADCMGCKLYLDRWKMWMEGADAPDKDKAMFLFFLYPDDREELQFLLEGDEFDYPVCIDMDNRMGELNGFTADTYLLLDAENHVVLTGNPIADERIKRLYLERIEKKP